MHHRFCLYNLIQSNYWNLGLSWLVDDKERFPIHHKTNRETESHTGTVINSREMYSSVSYLLCFEGGKAHKREEQANSHQKGIFNNLRVVTNASPISLCMCWVKMHIPKPRNVQKANARKTLKLRFNILLVEPHKLKNAFNEWNVVLSWDGPKSFSLKGMTLYVIKMLF